MGVAARRQLPAHDQWHHANHASGHLASNLQAQGMAQQVSNPATIGGNTDYVGQLKALLGERQQSGGASTVPLTNPYEQRLQELMSNPDAIANTNAYRFRFNEGQQALERSAAAKGMLRSGNTLAALTNYGQRRSQSGIRQRDQQARRADRAAEPIQPGPHGACQSGAVNAASDWQIARARRSVR